MRGSLAVGDPGQATRMYKQNCIGLNKAGAEHTFPFRIENGGEFRAACN